MSSLAATSARRRPDVEVTDRPILMAAPMVRATLRDEKRKTRRIVKPQPERVLAHDSGPIHIPAGWRRGDLYGADNGGSFAAHLADHCPYGAPGDRLWVRETWAAGKCAEGLPPSCLAPAFWLGPRSDNGGLWYAADDAQPLHAVTPRGKWRPSIHMPRWASRITLAVESVRVERLHDITEEDARAEGVTSPDVEQSPCLKCGGAGPFSCVCRGTGHYLDSAICPQCLGERLHTALGAGLGAMEVDCTDCDTYRKRFRNLWNHINGAEAWAANPWVWVIGFSRVSP